MEEGSGDEGSEASIGGTTKEPNNKDTEIENIPLHPKRSWSTLLLHASIMGGREFLYAVEIVLVTPIILQLGMPEKYYSFMWCFSPVIGVLVGPILGSSSDHCKSRFGRRRPYIVGLVVGAIIGLTLLIFSRDIATQLGGSSYNDHRIWGIVVGVVGAQLMDFCLDQTETPLRAYTLDVCSPKDQQRAFTLQTVFIGIGGALGFVVDGIDWQNTALSSIIDSQIEVVYAFALFAYLVSTLCNLFSIKEIPLTRNRSTSSCNATITKRVVTSQLPLLRKSESVQMTSRTDGSTQTTPGDLKNGNVPTKFQNGKPSILVSIYEDDCDEKDLQELPARHSQTMFNLPYVSLSKGLFISTSCPGGLDENNVDSSFPAQSNDDSAFEEDSNLKSMSSLEDGGTTKSLPSLEIKKSSTLTRGKSLLNFIRTKEFSIRNFRTKNRVIDIGCEWKNTSEVTNLNSKKDEGDVLIENSTVHSNLHTEALIKHQHSDTICNPNNQVSSVNSTPCGNGHLNQTNAKTESTHKKTTKTPKKKKKGVKSSLKQLWLSIATMPSQLKWLCLSQLLGFIGLETLMLWYTDLMGRVVYQGDPQAPEDSESFRIYNDGVKMGCWGLAIYSVAMVMFSVFMEKMRILKRFSIRTLYSFSFLLMAVTMLVMFVFTNRYVILSISWAIGVSVAVLLTVPYVLVGKYHLNAKYVMRSPGNTKRGFGLDCGILACQMYAGNMISASISSPVIFLAGSVKAMLLLTGACYLFGFFFAYLFVTYPGERKSHCQSKVMVERSTETL